MSQHVGMSISILCYNLNVSQFHFWVWTLWTQGQFVKFVAGSLGMDMNLLFINHEPAQLVTNFSSWSGSCPSLVLGIGFHQVKAMAKNALAVAEVSYFGGKGSPLGFSPLSARLFRDIQERWSQSYIASTSFMGLKVNAKPWTWSSIRFAASATGTAPDEYVLLVGFQ